MRSLNMAVSLLFLVAGLLFTVFMVSQAGRWNIGVAIGVVLALNGLVRLMFALDEEPDEPEYEDER